MYVVCSLHFTPGPQSAFFPQFVFLIELLTSAYIYCNFRCVCGVLTSSRGRQKPWKGTTETVFAVFSEMARGDTVFCSLATHEKGILIDSLTFINQRRSHRLCITTHAFTTCDAIMVITLEPSPQSLSARGTTQRFQEGRRHAAPPEKRRYRIEKRCLGVRTKGAIFSAASQLTERLEGARWQCTRGCLVTMIRVMLLIHGGAESVPCFLLVLFLNFFQIFNVYSQQE